MKNPLDKIFATEEIAKAVIALGFNEPCIGKHAGFKQFGEGHDKLQNKFVYNTDKDGPWTDLQQKYDMPFFTIYPAPVWQQITEWFRDTHDIDIDVFRIKREGKIEFEYSVMVSGKVNDTGRMGSYLEALEKATLLAINIVQCK